MVSFSWLVLQSGQAHAADGDLLRPTVQSPSSPLAAHPALPGAPVLLAALCCICCENTPCLWAHGLLTIKFLGTGVSR